MALILVRAKDSDGNEGLLIMPGIVGLITKQRGLGEAELRRMISAMRHEEFYVEGTWIDERLGVYLGWVERRQSFADCMPLRGEDG